MATIPTAIGPIAARQINRNFYVGQSDLTTIQKAVTAAVATGGTACVAIPPGYGGSDAISAVTGGSANVYISDLRGTSPQNYAWSGAGYVPADFSQLGGFITRGIPQPATGTMQMGFDPAGTSGIGGVTGTGYILATANAGADVPSFQLQSQRSDGGPLYTFMRCDLDNIGEFRIQMPQVLELNNDEQNLNLWVGQSRDTDGSQGFYIWAIPSLNLIDLQAETVNHAFRPTIAINRLGGDVEIALLGTITAGDIDAQNLDVAGDIVSQTCEVDGSPVRTFANTPDSGPGEGMVWPPIGIPVSQGTAWGTSLSPASLATWPDAGIAVSTGTAWATPITVGSLATWPAAGVPVSTGTAWGTSIPAADVARYSAPAPAFTLLRTSGNISGTGLDTITAGLTMTWNPRTGFGESAFINNRGGGGGGFVWYNVASNTHVDGTTVPGMILDSWNSLNISSLVLYDRATRAAIPATANISSLDSTNLILNGGSGSNGHVWLNREGGGMYIFFGPQGAAGHIDNAGSMSISQNFQASGTITSGGGKAFRIPHPMDESKDLTHACIEGPETAVFYRGEGVTAGGWAEITLPDYFEALTMQDNRSVLLTALFEEDDEPISTIAASRVKEGKFKVWSALPMQKFYWEVKAVRADIEPLTVTTQREAKFQPPQENEKKWAVN